MTIQGRDDDAPDGSEPDLGDQVLKLDDDAVTATVSALQDLMKQVEGVRARLDAKATTLLSAAGVSLTISGTLTTNAILNQNIVAPKAVLPLSAILCSALAMLVICAAYSVRALLVGPGNPTVDRDAFLHARPKASAWRQDIALHYHSTVEAMEAAIKARAPLVEKAQKHFLAFLVSLVILILSALGAHMLGHQIAWVGIVLVFVSALAVHTLTNPVKQNLTTSPPKKSKVRRRVVLERSSAPKVEAARPQAVPSASSRDDRIEQEHEAEEEAAEANSNAPSVGGAKARKPT